MAELRAVILVDNIGNEQLKGEWGLSIYLEFREKKILLDAGASGLFLKNASRLGIVLADVDYAVLSHAHYDHANGMPDFFAVNQKARLYLQSCCGENCYGRKNWMFKKYIGISKGMLAEYADRFQLVSGRENIMDGVELLPHNTDGLKKLGKLNHLYIKQSGIYQADNFAHEQSLILHTKDGIVILNSCSHGGIDTILRETRTAFPRKKILALGGGFHLYHMSDHAVKNFAEQLLEADVKKVYTGHCTGERHFG